MRGAAAASPPAGGEAGGAAERFLAWLRREGTARDRAVRNLVWNFYEPAKKRGEWIYPMLSGKAVLWFLKRGAVDEATAVASSLVRWQQGQETGMLARSYGAFPSQIAQQDGTWTAGDRYYAGDNLVILEALCALYEKSRDERFLNAAIGVGTWLVDVMCKGHTSGLWVEDHGAPMYFVTASGDYANEIHNSVEMLWIGALPRLGKLTGEDAYTRQVERAQAFYRQGQAQNGAYLDRYDPGFPAEPYSAGRWKPYQPGQVIADNVLRSALGACRAGDMEGARKLFQWIKSDGGGFPAYLDLETGGHGFPSDDEVYFDVTSTALHRCLASWLGEKQAVAEDEAFLARLQHESGAWYWGVTKKDLTGVRGEIGAIVGFWATADLSVP